MMLLTYFRRGLLHGCAGKAKIGRFIGLVCSMVDDMIGATRPEICTGTSGPYWYAVIREQKRSPTESLPRSGAVVIQYAKELWV